MKLSTQLAKDTGNGVLVVSPTAGGISCLFLGSSLPSTTRPGEAKEGAIVFDLSGLNDDLEQHVLAVVVRWTSGQYPALLKMSRAGIELDKAFVPNPDRLADIVKIASGCYALRVFYRPNPSEAAVIFTTQPKVPGTSYVADGNLLCQFLVGKVGIDELQAAATAVQAEISAREQLARLQEIIQREKGGWTSDDLAADLEGILTQMAEEKQRVDSDLSAKHHEFASLHEETNKLRTIWRLARCLISALNEPSFLARRRAIKEQKEELIKALSTVG